MLSLVCAGLSTFHTVKAELETSSNTDSGQLEALKKVIIRKCCQENEILVELDVGIRTCQLRADYIKGMKYSQ